MPGGSGFGGWECNGFEYLTVGLYPLEGPVFVEDDLPSVVVNAAVVNSAEWDEVVEVGGTTVLPKHDVVDFAAGEFDVTHRALRSSAILSTWSIND